MWPRIVEYEDVVEVRVARLHNLDGMLELGEEFVVVKVSVTVFSWLEQYAS